MKAVKSIIKPIEVPQRNLRIIETLGVIRV